MRWNKLTLVTSLLVPFFFVLNSCQPDDAISRQTTYSKNGIVISGTQENPPNPSTGTGLLNVSYNKVTKILNYNFTWSGLTGPLTAGHIHGLAPVGFNIGVVQSFSGLAAAAAGTYSSSVVIDGVKIKEVDLLNGLYYVNLHTAAFPGGEIRGQIIFK